MFQDDYKISLSPTQQWSWARNLGRPLFALWCLTFRLDARASDVAANILLRWLQGGLHCLTGTMVAYVLWREGCRRWAAVLAALLFVCWCFSTEAVLWRGAGINVLAALLSVLGVTALRLPRTHRGTWEVVGGFCVTLSMLATQSSAMAGLTLWAVVLGLAACNPGGLRERSFGRQTAVLLGGYLLGGLMSWAILHYSVEPNPRALPPSTDFHKTFAFVRQLNLLVLCNPLYPPWLSRAYLALVGLTAGVVAAGGVVRVRRQPLAPLWGLVSLACLAACTVFPYITLLLVQQLWPAWRNLYVAPLGLGGLVAVGIRWAEARPLPSLAYLALVLAVLGLNGQVARGNAAEYVRCEKRDLQVLQTLHDFAREHHISKVIVMLPAIPVRDWNGYDFHYVQADSHASIYVAQGMLPGFLARFSHLQLISDDLVKKRAVRQLQEHPLPPRQQFFLIEGTDIIAICPP
jgi:hypothetical protein